MNLEEKYPRPCFAVCSKCGKQGAIVFKDGSLSEDIVSIKQGERVIKELTDSGKLSRNDADRIGDHLACSNLFQEVSLVILELEIANEHDSVDPTRN